MIKKTLIIFLILSFGSAIFIGGIYAWVSFANIFDNIYAQVAILVSPTVVLFSVLLALTIE